MNLALWLERAGRAMPDAPAIGLGTRMVYDYRALAMRAAKIAGGLRAGGMKAGERVAIVAKNQPDYAALMFGVWHAGLACVPVNAKLHGAEIGYILDHSGARICFVSKDMETEVAAHAPKSLERLVVIGGAEYERLLSGDATGIAAANGSDLAWLFYTSGTTGRPKGAMLTHRNLNWAAHAYIGEVDETRPGDPILHAAPMSHGSGMYMLPHVARGGVNIVPESGAFEPEEIFAQIAAWPRLSMFAAPTMIKRLVDSKADCRVENIRTFVWGGAPMYVEDIHKALDRFGPRLAQIYGQGESPMTITVLSKQEVADKDHPRWLERIASAGKAYSCLEVRVAGADDALLAPGEIGEIICRGDIVMAGYWKNEEATARTLANGWLPTGDDGASDQRELNAPEREPGIGSGDLRRFHQRRIELDDVVEDRTGGQRVEASPVREHKNPDRAVERQRRSDGGEQRTNGECNRGDARADNGEKCHADGCPRDIEKERVSAQYELIVMQSQRTGDLPPFFGERCREDDHKRQQGHQRSTHPQKRMATCACQ